MKAAPILFSGITFDPQNLMGSLKALTGSLLGVLAIALALGLILWLYRRETRLVARRVALSLMALRGAAILVILITIVFDPTFTRTRTEEIPARVLIAWDESDSMRITDPERSTVEKLSLIRALHLAPDLYSDAELLALIEQCQRSGEPAFAPVDSPTGQRERKRFAEALQRVDNLSRLELALQAVDHESFQLIETLKERHSVVTTGFSHSLRPLPPQSETIRKELIQAKNPNNKTPTFTDLKLPLLQASDHAGNSRTASESQLLGVIVFTDGRHNWGESPRALAQQLGQRKVPIYPVLVAPEKPPADIAVIQARPQTTTVFKGSLIPIEVEVRVAGWPAGPVKVTLTESEPGGQQNKAPLMETIEHTGKDSIYRLTLKTKLDTPGPQSLVIVAEGAGKTDRFPDNNKRTARVNVVKDRARVLLIDGEARWEFHYLHTCLGRDENMDLRSVVFRQPRVTRATDEEVRTMGIPAREMPADPDALSGIDCIILGDVEPSQFPLPERERLEKYVADNGGTLVLLAGKRAMPVSYAQLENDPLRKLMPIRKPYPIQEPAGFQLSLNPEADRAWFLQLGDSIGENRETWGRLPPSYWAVSGEAKEGAEVLASLPGKPLRESVLIAKHNYGFGRVLYVGIDSTWRWRFKSGDYYHHRFWGQVAQWAASDRLLPTVNATGTIRFGTREPTFRSDQDVEFVLRATEAVKKLSPQAIRGIKIIRLPDEPNAKERPARFAGLNVTEGKPRELTASVKDLNPGRYALELDIPEWADQLRGPPDSDGKLTTLRSRFEVTPPDGEELVELSGNRELLEQMAAASGGKVYTPENVSELLQEMKNQVATREELVHRSARKSWWTFALFVLLLTVEWTLRKWHGLP